MEHCWFDYTGSSPQVQGALNSTLSFTHSLTYLSVRCVLAKDVPNNVGLFSLHYREGAGGFGAQSCDAGAMRGARAHGVSRVRHHARRAPRRIVPDKVPAAGEGGNSVICNQRSATHRQPFINRGHDLRRLGRTSR